MPSNPVQSIRVATALFDRVGVLGKPRSMKASEAELAIGEAQQLFPEIWSNLDDARNALAAQDRDVAAYDLLRGETRRATLESGDNEAIRYHS